MGEEEGGEEGRPKERRRREEGVNWEIEPYAKGEVSESGGERVDGLPKER